MPGCNLLLINKKILEETFSLSGFNTTDVLFGSMNSFLYSL